MKLHQRIRFRRARRAGLIASLVTGATVAGVTTAYSQPPDRPVRLPAVRLPAVTKQVAVAEAPPPSVKQKTKTGPQTNLVAARSLTTAEVKARLAALKKPEPKLETASVQAPPAKWLRTSTATARVQVAREHLAKASHAYDVGAWLSAESSAWESLRWSAEAIDLRQRETGAAVETNQSATAKLRFARQAILEAREFTRWTVPSDADAIVRMARSHVTKVLHDVPADGLTATDASDRYLDAARVALSSLATESIEAAQAMDLLAATYLTRAEAKQLPGPTSLCLRRAALKGQPQNASLAYRLGAQLADAGLLNEAQWALQHSLTIEPNPQTASTLAAVLRRNGQGEVAEQLLVAYAFPRSTSANASAPSDPNSTIKIPQITQLSPEQFAAVSPPVISESSSTGGLTVQAASARVSVPQSNATLSSATLSSALAQPNTIAQPAVIRSEDSEDKEPGMIRSFFGSLRKVW